MSIRPFLPAWKACSRAIEALRGKAATIPWHNSDPEPPVTMKQVFAESIKAERDRTEQYREIRSLRGTVRELTQIVMEKDGNSVEDFERQQYRERVHEWHEARQMTGTGPWLVAESRALLNEPGVTGMKLRESNPIAAQGAYGDIELALQNVNWRREINLSWLEFSRWGIQQIILISRLYYIKNPIIRRLIDIAAQYVFARGFELSSPDEDANQVLKDFLERNQATLGQIALTNHERSKYQDGNLFFVFFPDEENTGEVNLRTIDATEIMDIICNPDDADDPWYYRRCWTQRCFDAVHGTVSTKSVDKWYPALGFDPENRKNPDGSPMEKINSIAGVPIIWENPVYHRKCGTVAKWHFGTPLIYPAIDWAREGRKYLEACASVMQSLMQIALIIKTKGGQQALAGVKAQQETSVGPSTALYDQNPPAVPGATFASGTGTSLEAFKTTGAGQDPERVRQFKLMCCMVVGVPETFLADVSTGNLATATTLDRPTELVFLERQEAWREDLVIIGKYVLSVSAKATNGKLREALESRAIQNPEEIVFSEGARHLTKAGNLVYVSEGNKKLRPKTIEVKCVFPSILEGDVQQLITAISTAMTLGNKAGQIIGIDQKAGITMLFETLGYENAAELVEDMYPEDTYDPERSQEEPLGAPIPGTTPPGTAPGAPGSPATPQQDSEDEPQQQGSPTPLPAQPANKALPANKIAVSAHVRSKPSKKLKEAVGRWLLMLEAGEPKP